jgi:DNA invertase Pin-like site-specific DNA recombinase
MHQLDKESLEVQTRQINGFCMQHGYNLEKIFEDRAVSGGKPLATRTEAKKLLKVLEKGDRVVASKLDRMFRSTKDCLEIVEDFRKRGIDLCLLDLGGSVTDSAISKLFFTMAVAFAEFERGRISERIKDAKSVASEKGIFRGGSCPFGYRIDKRTQKLIPVPKQQAAIKKAVRLRKRGATWAAIQQEIKEVDKYNITAMGIKKVVLRQSPELAGWHRG